MSAILTEAAIIAVLLVLNGVFAMSELAIVAAKRVRLERQAESGDAGARAALAIAAHPGEFVSTVQVGITLVGVIASVYGGATIAEQLAAQLPGVSWIGERAEAVALGLVVAAITYCSVIIGELVPKRIALGNPEKVAAIIARPMRLLARVGSPLVRLLTGSTQLILRLFGVRGIPEPGLSEGVLVCDGDIEHVLGSVHASDLLVRVVDGHPVELRPVIREALFVPATTPVFQLLESFRTTKRDVAVVLDEYGGISGVASYVDIVASLLGRSESTIDAPRIVAEGTVTRTSAT